MNERTDRFNLPYLLELLDDICRDCDDPQRKENCARPGCLIGFAKKCLMFSIQSGSLEVPGAVTLMPKDDFNSTMPNSRRRFWPNPVGGARSAGKTIPRTVSSPWCAPPWNPRCSFGDYTLPGKCFPVWLRFASRIQNGRTNWRLTCGVSDPGLLPDGARRTPARYPA